MAEPPFFPTRRLKETEVVAVQSQGGQSGCKRRDAAFQVLVGYREVLQGKSLAGRWRQLSD